MVDQPDAMLASPSVLDSQHSRISSDSEMALVSARTFSRSCCSLLKANICSEKSPEGNQSDTAWLQAQIEIKDEQISGLLRQQNQQIIMAMNRIKDYWMATNRLGSNDYLGFVLAAGEARDRFYFEVFAAHWVVFRHNYMGNYLISYNFSRISFRTDRF